MPKHQRKIIVLLPLLAQLKKSALASLRVEQVDHESVDLAFFIDCDGRIGYVATREEDTLVRGRVRQGWNGIGRGVRVSLDTAQVRVILQVVLHVRDGLWRDEPRHGEMRSSNLVKRGVEVDGRKMGVGERVETGTQRPTPARLVTRPGASPAFLGCPTTDVLSFSNGTAANQMKFK